MAWKLMGAIAGGVVVLGVSALVLIAATQKIDYDPNQPRAWQKAYTLRDAQYPTMIDSLSIKGTPEGVQWDEMTKTRSSRGEGMAIQSYTLNCESGGHTRLKTVWLNAEGQPTEQDLEPVSYGVEDSPQILAVHRALCGQVGMQPGF